VPLQDEFSALLLIWLLSIAPALSQGYFMLAQPGSGQVVTPPPPSCSSYTRPGDIVAAQGISAPKVRHSLMAYSSATCGDATVAPTVTALSPTTGATTGVTITGTNFTYVRGVSFCGIATRYTVASATSILATSPAGTAAGACDVQVTTVGGTSATNSGDVFTYTGPAGGAPTIPSYAVAAGYTYMEFLDHFTTLNTIDINGTDAPGYNWYVDIYKLFSGHPDGGICYKPPGTFTIVNGTDLNIPDNCSTHGGDKYYSGYELFSFNAVAQHATGWASGPIANAGYLIDGSKGFFLEVRAQFPNPVGTSNALGQPVSVFGSCQAIWLATYDTISQNPAALAAHWGEMDLMAVWTDGSGFLWNDVTNWDTWATSTNSGGSLSSSLGYDYSAYHTWSALYTPMAEGGGTGSVTYYMDGVPWGPVTTWTAGSEYSILEVGKYAIDISTCPSLTAPFNIDYVYVAVRPPAPTINNVTPTNGSLSGGTSITITGTGFSTPTSVNFCGTLAPSYTVNGPTSITAVSPAGSLGACNIQVTTPGGVSAINSGDVFTYVPSAPAVTDLSPGSGPPCGGHFGEDHRNQFHRCDAGGLRVHQCRLPQCELHGQQRYLDHG
jgi:hypothetical protein